MICPRGKVGYVSFKDLKKNSPVKIRNVNRMKSHRMKLNASAPTYQPKFKHHGTIKTSRTRNKKLFNKQKGQDLIRIIKFVGPIILVIILIVTGIRMLY